MTQHELPLERRTLHGHFSRELKPVLEIESGDEVVFRTLDADWSTGEDSRRFEPRDPELDEGHALCGPVALRGSGPGMTLAIHVEELVTGPIGWTAVAGTALNEALGVADGKDYRMSWELDRIAGIARNNHGLHARMRPFLGVMGVAPQNRAAMQRRRRGRQAATSTAGSSLREAPSTCRSPYRWRSFRQATDTPRRATARLREPPSSAAWTAPDFASSCCPTSCWRCHGR